MARDPAFDLPLPAFIEERCTQALPPRERFEHWRGWHPSVQLIPLTKAAGSAYDARVIRYRTADGTSFGFTQSGDVESHFGHRHPADYFLLSLTVSGSSVAQDGRTTLSQHSGGYYLIDGRRPVRIRTDPGHSHLYLVLPREPVITSVTRDPLSDRESIAKLEGRGLLAVAGAQLRALPHTLPDLDEPELVAAIKSIAALAVFGLKRQLGDSRDVDRPLAYEMVYLSARRLMESYCANPQLTASAIAAAIGCSRAHLYRAFANQHTSVAEALRDIRLKKAQALLRGPQQRTVAQVAALSGFSDQSSFSRAFRAAVGVAPRAWRRMAHD